MKTKVFFAVVTAMLSIVLCSCKNGYGMPPRCIGVLFFAEDATVVVEYYTGKGEANEECILHTDTIVCHSYDDRIYYSHTIGAELDNLYDKHPEYFCATITRISGDKPIYAVYHQGVVVNGQDLKFIDISYEDNFIEHPQDILEAMVEQTPEYIDVFNDNQLHLVKMSTMLGVWPEVSIE